MIPEVFAKVNLPQLPSFFFKVVNGKKQVQVSVTFHSQFLALKGH